MKRVFFFSILFIVTSCNSDRQNTPGNNGPIKAVAGYKPQAFRNDNRVEQIRSIIPRFHQQMEAFAKSKGIPAVAYGIVVDNQLVMDSAVGVINLEKQLPASTQSSFRIASMSKSFTAMAIMKLVEDGKVMPNNPASKYIPELDHIEYLTSDATPMTIENLLTMTAGFPEDNAWGDRQLDEPDSMLLNLMKSGPSLSNIPSYSYEYSNTGYALLGKVISNVTGKPYQQYISEELLKPLGMNETYWEYNDVPEDQLVIGYAPDSITIAPMLHDGSFGAMGGLITSIQDFSKYVSFHLSAWPPRNDPDKGPVKRSSLRKMHQPQFVRLLSSAKDANNEPCPEVVGYGYGLRIRTNCQGIREVGHGGALPGFGSNYVFYPDLGIGLMAFCNLTYTAPWELTEIKKLLFEEIKLEPRVLPPSDILLQRQAEVVELINTWDPQLEKRILAENFYLDQNRKLRKQRIDSLLAIVGDIQQVTDIEPLNQLRGHFEMIGEQDTLNIWFTLSPESDPKVQRLVVW